MKNKMYVAVVQCHLVKQRCSGFFCEKAFHDRSGGFSDYPEDTNFRTLYMTCGGCCGRALHRKLGNLIKNLKRKDNLGKETIIVQLSSCITKDNYHGPPCPHLDYLKTLIEKLGLDYREDTAIAEKSEKLRKEGVYQS